MAVRKQSSFDGQNADKMGVKDSLVSIAANQTNPYDAKARDFPDGKTSADARHGQGSGASWENRDAGGKDDLVKLNDNQEGPRNAEANMEGGNAIDDSMSERAQMVARNFPIERNRGESSSSAQSPMLAESIDKLEGRIKVSGYSATCVDEVPDRQVSIG